MVEETQRPLDLERGPVMRVNLFTRSAHENPRAGSYNTVMDFWSLAVILNEFGEMYPAEKAGLPGSLFVRWQDRMLAGHPSCRATNLPRHRFRLLLFERDDFLQGNGVVLLLPLQPHSR
jgi:hypothetical protein